MVLDKANETKLGTLADHLQILWVLRENLRGQLASIQAHVDDLIASHETDAKKQKPANEVVEKFQTSLAWYVAEFKNFLLPFHMVSRLLESSLDLDFRGLLPEGRQTICIRKDFVVIARANDLREDWRCPCHALVEAISGYTKPSQKESGSFTFEVMLIPLYPLEAPKEDAAEPAPQAEAPAAPKG